MFVVHVLVVVWQASHTGGNLIRMWLPERVVAWQPAASQVALKISLWFICPTSGRDQAYTATTLMWQLAQLSLVLGWGLRIARFFPPTKVPLWQLEQAVGLSAWLWLNVMMLFHGVGFFAWQASQRSLVCNPSWCLPSRPLAPL